MTDRDRDFLNRLKCLYFIDRCQLPEIDWPVFRDNPLHYLIHADDIEATAILREVEKRQKPAAEGNKP
jgi:hypothetical protein